MARFNCAKWLGEHAGGLRMVRYDIVCVHTIVGYAPAHAAHFSVHHDGRIEQSRDTKYRSAANLNGNHRVVAIENEDHGPAFRNWSGSNVPPLTDAQVIANAKILAEAHQRHGVPLQLCPNSKPGSKGLAYHRQGIDGNFGVFDYPGRVSGGEVWTEHRGKVCPGDKRISQLPEILRQAKIILGVINEPVDEPTEREKTLFCKRGDDSDVVLYWKLKLEDLGFFTSSDNNMDGVYGSGVSSAVKKANEAGGSSASGDVIDSRAATRIEQQWIKHSIGR